MANFGPFSQKIGGARAPLAPPVPTALRCIQKLNNQNYTTVLLCTGCIGKEIKLNFV